MQFSRELRKIKRNKIDLRSTIYKEKIQLVSDNLHLKAPLSKRKQSAENVNLEIRLV